MILRQDPTRLEALLEKGTLFANVMSLASWFYSS
jgi:hypothetical protein